MAGIDPGPAAIGEFPPRRLLSAEGRSRGDPIALDPFETPLNRFADCRNRRSKLSWQTGSSRIQSFLDNTVCGWELLTSVPPGGNRKRRSYVDIPRQTQAAV